MNLGSTIAGIVTFYKDFVESLYEQLGGKASITGMLRPSLSFYTFIYPKILKGVVSVVLIHSYWAHIPHKQGTCRLSIPDVLVVISFL